MVWQGEVELVLALATETNTLEPQQTSNAVGLMKDHVEPHWTVWLLEQVIIGGTVSMMVTVWAHVVELLQQSVACQVRVIMIGHTVEALVTVLRTAMVTLVPQQASIAVGGVNDHVELHCTVMLLAQVITGGWVSCSTTRWLQNAEFEQQSVIIQLRV